MNSSNAIKGENDLFFFTWKIEEGVKYVETLCIVSLDELVGVVVLDVFPL